MFSGVKMCADFIGTNDGRPTLHGFVTRRFFLKFLSDIWDILKNVFSLNASFLRFFNRFTGKNTKK